MKYNYGLVSPTRLTFDEAFLYCITLNHDGHKDWIMPTFTMWVLDDLVTGWHDSAHLQRDSNGTSRVVPVRIYD